MHPDSSAPQLDTLRAARTRRERKALAWQGRQCENCSVALQGPFCHQCGQPERTPIRNLLALSSDAVDYLFDVDARVYRTLRSLFFFPGRLTELYLRGERMSFVRPLRVYLIISALLFVVVNATSDIDGVAQFNDEPFKVENDSKATTSDAKTLDTSATDKPAAAGGPAAPEKPEAPDKTEQTDKPQTSDKPKKEPISLTIFGDTPWHRTDNPFILSGLPTSVNDWMNDYIGIIETKLQLVRDDPKRLGHAFLQVLPQSLFVLLPIFALLLKIVLIFKRRMYMEHLMVAVHSHTFIYIGILLSIGLSKLAEHWPTGWANPWWLLMGLAIAWIPLNLFLTQKRVYRQTWWGASIGFMVISTLYLCLISLTTMGALVMSLVSL